MRIYFAAAMRGGRDNLATNQQIVAYLAQLGHDVLTLQVTHDDVVTREDELTDRQIYERDLKLLSQADALIAEATTPSLGTGFEIAEALRQGLPVVCLYRTDVVARLSPLIAGNPDPRFTLVGYTKDGWRQPLERFLRSHATSVGVS